MAGTILVSEGHSLPTDSFTYHFIVEKTRPHFLAEEQHILKKIYHGEDDAALMFISVRDVDKNDFNIFYRATKEGYQKALIDYPETTKTVAWAELLDILQADPRYEPSFVSAA
jgi:hypothetical protein